MGDFNFLVFSKVILRTLGTLNGNIGQKWIKLHSMVAVLLPLHKTRRIRSSTHMKMRSVFSVPSGPILDLCWVGLSHQI